MLRVQQHTWFACTPTKRQVNVKVSLLFVPEMVCKAGIVLAFCRPIRGVASSVPLMMVQPINSV